MGVITAYLGVSIFRRAGVGRVAINPSPHSQVAFPTFPPTPSPEISGPFMALTPTISISPRPSQKVPASPTGSFLASVTATPTTPRATPLPALPTSTATTKWGAYVSWDPSAVTAFQDLVGRKASHIATFVHWGNESDLPLDLGNLAKANNQTLILFWEAMDYNVDSPEDPRFAYDAVLTGKWDNYLTAFASQVKSFGGNVVLVPFEEMNGDWYPWPKRP